MIRHTPKELTVPTSERVTVTLPAGTVESIDKLEKNRSRFIAQAIRRELEHRRHEELQRSIDNPHPEAGELADAGFDDWATSLPTEDDGLVETAAGTQVVWVPGEGWREP
jgi:hypothetical protein